MSSKGGHSPEVGSSKKISEGAAMMPAAMASRFRSPPLNPRKDSPPGKPPPTCLCTLYVSKEMGVVADRDRGQRKHKQDRIKSSVRQIRACMHPHHSVLAVCILTMVFSQCVRPTTARTSRARALFARMLSWGGSSMDAANIAVSKAVMTGTKLSSCACIIRGKCLRIR